MIKRWRLFDNITIEQMKQLSSAGIYIRIEDDTSEIEFPIYGKLQFVKSQDVYVTTTKESQETLLQLMFPAKLLLLEVENDR